jgi:hypothetical protein
MFCGRMAELVDASVLGTDRAICVGSSPISPTKKILDYESNSRK